MCVHVSDVLTIGLGACERARITIVAFIKSLTLIIEKNEFSACFSLFIAQWLWLGHTYVNCFNLVGVCARAPLPATYLLDQAMCTHLLVHSLHFSSKTKQNEWPMQCSQCKK